MIKVVYEKNAPEEIDEIIAPGIHLEKMGDGLYFLSVTSGKENRAFDISTKKRGRCVIVDQNPLDRPRP